MSAGPLAWVAYELEGECFDLRVVDQRLGHGGGGERQKHGDDEATQHSVSPWWCGADDPRACGMVG